MDSAGMLGGDMQSETIGALAAALAKAQGSIKAAQKDSAVKTNSYSYSYATLAQLWESARDALSANGLAVTQTTDMGGNGDIILVTTLLHASGEWVGGVYPVRAKDSLPQSLGSAMTYARRYALSAMLGLTSDDDDDGNAASGNVPAKAPARTQNGGTRPPAPPAPKPTPSEQAEHGESYDNPFTSDEAAELRKMHAIGTDLYGDGWNDKRHDLAKWASRGRTASSKQLTLAELRTLTAALAKRQAEREAAAIVDGIAEAPEMAH